MPANRDLTRIPAHEVVHAVRRSQPVAVDVVPESRQLQRVGHHNNLPAPDKTGADQLRLYVMGRRNEVLCGERDLHTPPLEC